MRSATGKTAGPERPPVVFARRGFLVFRSIRIPSRVLIRLMPSAPASSQAFAIDTMSVTFGESLAMAGFVVTAFTALITLAAASGSVPKLMPPPWTLGQLILISSHPTCSSLSNNSLV